MMSSVLYQWKWFGEMILLSYLNTKLRDFYPTLDALCDDLQIDGGEVSRRLAAIDCRYSPERNQFVSC